MTSPDELKKAYTNSDTSNSTSSSSSADKLAAMRQGTLIPGRVITHSYNPSDTSVGRLVTESDHSVDCSNNNDNE